MANDTSRYAAVSRRAALTGALGTAMVGLAACGNNNDATALKPGASTPTSSTASTGSSTTPAGAAAASGPALPASAKLTVSFTFGVTSGGGMVRNPYIAVWVENASGALVKTVALWHENHGGQDRWLSEMRQFSTLSATDAQTVSSATKQPGSYTVAWDGSTLSGARSTADSYRLFIEASREHGPYELLQQDITVGSQAASFPLTPSGELTAASAAYTV